MKKFSFLLLLTGLVPLLASCKQNPDYFSHVSELRSDLFTASEEEFSLTVACITREHPYNNDGIKATLTDVVEITLEGEADEYRVYLLGGEQIGGEMSFLFARRKVFPRNERYAPRGMGRRATRNRRYLR